MPWRDKVSATQETGVDNTVTYMDKEVHIAAGQVAAVQISWTGNNTTDNFRCRLYFTLDDTAEVWDTLGVDAFTAAPAVGDQVSLTSEQRRSFTVSGPYRFRVGVQSTGAATTFTVDMDYRVDGVEM